MTTHDDLLVLDKSETMLQRELMKEYHANNKSGFPIDYESRVSYPPNGNVYGWNGDKWQRMRWNSPTGWVFK